MADPPAYANGLMIESLSPRDRAEWSHVAPIAAAAGMRIAGVSLGRLDAEERIAALRREGFRTLGFATRAQTAQRKRALAAGIDEFLTTGPIEPGEAGARLALLGTGSALPADFRIQGDIAVIGARTIALNPREAALLERLHAARGGFVTHADLLVHAWGQQAQERREYLRVAIGAMRARIEPEPDLPRYLLSEAAIGYRLGTGTRQAPPAAYMS